MAEGSRNIFKVKLPVQLLKKNEGKRSIRTRKKKIFRDIQKNIYLRISIKIKIKENVQ